ncbi:UvrD-helicase domain-containing protein [Halolamina salina]|uniref:DNA 3'-5' helicase n=1 Tax=Halolamina salina TaxID=1220023 RepID=A0ABD6B9Z0_9EURY
MNHDEVSDQLSLALDPEFEFTSDQANVMHAFHEGSGRVAVGSGAGTGKTTTLTRVVAETVVRMTSPNPGQIDTNPFDEILVTTFTRDAAGQLKTKIKQLLRDHETYGEDEFDPALWRWIETDSNISTIDSFVGDLLREIAPEAHVAPDFDVRDELETEDLLRDVVRTLREDDDYTDALETLENELDGTTPRQYLYDIHQKLREVCYRFPDPDADEGTTIFQDGIRDDIYNERDPPFSEADIRNVVSHVTGEAESSVSVPDDDGVQRGIEADYRHSMGFAAAVDDLIDAFDAEYDAITRETGQLSYQDITYIVWLYLEDDASPALTESLANRFSKIFVDEFQDTSYAQCQILNRLVEPSETGSDILVIGDVKQSIYTWRSADPEIFARILAHADTESDEPDPYLEAAGWTRTELVTNFRSHPHLVYAGNHLFDRVFRDPGMGAIGTFPIEYQPLQPHRPGQDDEAAHLHVLPLDQDTADEWRDRDPEVTAAAIRGMVDGDEVMVGDGEDERPVQAGDVTILFRRGTHMQSFRAALDDHGLDNAIVAERGLFKTEEIGFLVDVLDWFANPHSKDSLLRILRSPVTALADSTLRFLASHDWNLPRALEEWPDGSLPASDYDRLEGLVDLRGDLRWDREGSKAELIQKIIQHTGLEAILLAGDDAMQRYGNLWMLVELARDWEDEELLAYREFVDRLKRYRRMARSNDESFEVAQIADSSAEDTVKLRTVHSAKGLEFGVVVLADLLAGPGGRVQARDTVSFRDSMTGERRFALRPRPASDPVPFDDGPGSVWVQDDYRSTIWLAPDRDDQGRFQYDHPYNPAIQDEFAEFWRLLYVAFTRAEDHLLLPLGHEITHHHKWTSWAHPLIDVFQTGDGWTESGTGGTSFDLDASAMYAEDEPPATIPLDIGQLDRPDPKETAPIGLPEIETSADEPATDLSTWEGVPFAPRELSPSTLHDLVACPRRYQYRALQEVSEARGDSPPGSNAPEDHSPSYWGTVVHEAFEALHNDSHSADSDEGVSSNLDSVLDRHDGVREQLTELIGQYRESEVWNTVQNATTVLPEYELSAIHPTEPQVHISGLVDLLVQTEDGWEIIDFKTGEQPRSGSYLANQYRWQLATYAWMLNEEYDIEVTRTRLFYVQDGSVHDITTDWSDFETYLHQLSDDLKIEPEAGLPTDPDPAPSETEAPENPHTRCGSCPYKSICPVWKEK